MNKRKTYILLWAGLILAYPVGIGIGAILAHGQDAAGSSIGSALGALLGLGLALLFGVAISIATSESVVSSKGARISLRVLPWFFVALVAWATLLPPWEGSRLRTDLSATVTYIGDHDEIVLDCTDMYGAFGNRDTKRGEVVEIDSVRDDGRIVLAWGPDYNSKQEADLSVGPSIPEGGPPVVVVVTLSDTEATYEIHRK